jgi:hypothetical protein
LLRDLLRGCSSGDRFSGQLGSPGESIRVPWTFVFRTGVDLPRSPYNRSCTGLLCRSSLFASTTELSSSVGLDLTVPDACHKDSCSLCSCQWWRQRDIELSSRSPKDGSDCRGHSQHPLHTTVTVLSDSSILHTLKGNHRGRARARAAVFDPCAKLTRLRTRKAAGAHVPSPRE